MALSPGFRLGPYEILSPLGAGGMGEVYRAKDLQLHRTVAIKVLPDEVKSDRERLRRFEQEARAASALNHPNIVTVFGIGEAESVSYMATELVEGKTLAEILIDAPLPTKKVLEIGTQLAEGLAAAHEAGIVHRDLKPANVMVTKTGLVKILDFGLAKRPLPIGPADSTVSTVATPDTRPGAVMGTVGYMSPEQARGDEVDFRSDQFSLGSVLYEIATGRRAFRKSTHIDTMSAVLNEEPERIARIAPAVPAPLRWTIERCLAKLPAERYQSTRDLARELQGIREHISEFSESGMREQPAARWRKLGLVGGALVAAIVAGAALWSALSGSRTVRAGPDFRRLTFRSGVVARALFMQRSNSILYTASWDGQASRTYLTLPESKGADRSLEAQTHLPMAFSEDGSEVLVLLGLSRPAINSVGTLAWWPALGGKARPFLENSGWADWAKRGRFLAVVQEEGSARVLQVRDSAGKLRHTLFRTAGAIAFVSISPDEKEVAFIHHPSRIDDAGEIRIVSVDGARQRALTTMFERSGGLKWNPRTGEVWFTASRADIYSTALWGVDREGRLRMIHSFPDFFLLQDIAEEGCLFVASSEDTNLLLKRGEGAPSDFSWLGSTFITDISPDGRSILFSDGAPSAGTLGAWVRPLDGSEAIRIADGDPGKFSLDGRWVVFTTRLVAGTPQLAVVPAAGGKARVLTSSATAAYSKPSFTRGDMLLFIRSEGERREVWQMKIDGTGAESLGVTGCDDPVADPSATRLLCIEDPDHEALVLHGLAPREAGRRLVALPAGEKFLYARWNARGDRIFAITWDRRFLTLDSSTGVVLQEQKIPLREGIASESLLAAACSPDGVTQAYSINSTSSRLYLGRGVM